MITHMSHQGRLWKEVSFRDGGDLAKKNGCANLWEFIEKLDNKIFFTNAKGKITSEAYKKL